MGAFTEKFTEVDLAADPAPLLRAGEAGTLAVERAAESAREPAGAAPAHSQGDDVGVTALQ